ncbi:hypothetical protein GLOIN_2v1870015 [Rhizophagus irregularis DAOM 181602=DAOM 197198]|nr:hypothetical protein GLOIN_2v1870015 [Rhizophagus irregularis DAOM 181602=DAOM 197198]
MIHEEFKGDRNSLHSCLLVNKTWCEIIVPILWKNPWKYLEEDKKEKSQLNDDIPGVEYCLSELEYLKCHNNSDQNIFEE